MPRVRPFAEPSHHPDFRDLPLEPVASNDAVWLQDSVTNRMVIHSVATVDEITVEAFRDLWTERVSQADGGERNARFRKRIVYAGGAPHWQDDPDYALDRHIVAIDDPALETSEGLQEYIGRVASEPLPMDRSPWEILIVRRFEGGRSAIIVRMHHVLGDGIALVPVMFSLLDIDEEAAEDPSRAHVKTRGTVGKPWQIAAAAAVAGGPILVGQAVRPADESLFHGPELSGTKRVAWTPAIDLDRIKAIKRRREATVNDVIMSCVAGALRRYAIDRGQAPESARVSMPVNIRPANEVPKLENRFAAVFFELPVDVDGAAERLAETKRRMDALKRSAQPMVYYGGAFLMLKVLPRGVSRWILDYYASKCTAVLSNVPGPQQPMKLADRRVYSLLFWVPQRSNIGIGISVISLSGYLRVGIFGDTAVLADPDLLVAEVMAELEGMEAVL